MWESVDALSRSERNNESSMFQADFGGLKITILDSHIDYKGMWVMSCYELGINTRVLNCDTAEEAKERAVSIVESRLTNWLDAISKAKNS